MATREPDPLLRRVARTTAVLCAVAAVAALVIEGGRPDGALGVLVGTGLMAFSFKVIRDSVDARARRVLAEPGAQHIETVRSHGSSDPCQPATEQRSGAPVDPGGLMRHAWTLTKYVTRYGVLAVVAWAALVPLHASPVGVFVGVTLPVVAIALAAASGRR